MNSRKQLKVREDIKIGWVPLKLLWKPVEIYTAKFAGEDGIRPAVDEYSPNVLCKLKGVVSSTPVIEVFTVVAINKSVFGVSDK